MERLDSIKKCIFLPQRANINYSETFVSQSTNKQSQQGNRCSRWHFCYLEIASNIIKGSRWTRIGNWTGVQSEWRGPCEGCLSPSRLHYPDQKKSTKLFWLLGYCGGTTCQSEVILPVTPGCLCWHNCVTLGNYVMSPQLHQDLNPTPSLGVYVMQRWQQNPPMVGGGHDHAVPESKRLFTYVLEGRLATEYPWTYTGYLAGVKSEKPWGGSGLDPGVPCCCWDLPPLMSCLTRSHPDLPPNCPQPTCDTTLPAPGLPLAHEHHTWPFVPVVFQHMTSILALIAADCEICQLISSKSDHLSI